MEPPPQSSVRKYGPSLGADRQTGEHISVFCSEVTVIANVAAPDKTH